MSLLDDALLAKNDRKHCLMIVINGVSSLRISFILFADYHEDEINLPINFACYNS